MSVAPQANQPSVTQTGQPVPTTRGSVEAEVNAELAGSIAPLEHEAGQLAEQQARAIADLNNLFSQIMPFVQGSAQRVAANYGATNAAQQSIFAEAWSRLNALQSERAGRAQELAQQIGAPIPMDMFSAGIDLERMAFVPDAAGELLKASTIGQAGVQEAEAFAGRVFPLQRVRLESETRNYFRDQISDLRSQIATLKSQKPGMVNERLRQRQLEDYEMKLAQKEAEFERWATKRGLALEEKRLKEQIRSARAQEGLTKSGQKISANANKATKAANNRTYVNAKKQDLVSLANALATGGNTDYERRQLIRQPDGSIKSVIVTDTVSQPGVKSPSRLLNLLLAQTGIQKGQKELYNFAVKQVIQTLKTKGVQGVPNDPSKWEKWWKQRQKKLAPKGGPGPKGGSAGGGNEPLGPPAPDDTKGKGGKIPPPNQQDKYGQYDTVADAPPLGPPNTRGQYVVKYQGNFYLVSPQTTSAVRITKKRAQQFAAEVKGGG